MRKIIFKHFPEFSKHVPWTKELPTMEEVLRSPFVNTPEAVIRQTKKEIAALNEE